MSWNGYGYSFGDGYGYGYSYGDGHGNGDGYGFGYDHGNGSGSGYSFGGGYGHCYSFGDGNGVYGIDVGKIRGYSVVVNKTWRMVTIGCQRHSFEHWAGHWQSIARSVGFDVSKTEVDRMICEVRSVLERVSP